MTRTHREGFRSGAGGRKANNIGQRQAQVSRALSKVLRHQAENVGIAISKDGWVRLSDLLAWRGLHDASRFTPAVTVSEVMKVVEDDGHHGKGRFALMLAKDDQLASTGAAEEDGGRGGTIEIDGAATGQMVEATQQLSVAGTANVQESRSGGAHEMPSGLPSIQQGETAQDEKNSPETRAVIRYHLENPDEPASAFLIRATQGHSIKTIEAEGLLKPITLEDPTSIPSTVVHGTFYGAWSRIMSTGGLKPMSRNMVHFATGPQLSEVLPSTDHDQPSLSMKSKTDVDDLLSQNKVISGMRWDAEILIYIDLRRLLQDVQDKGWEMQWWRSDNGVILTEGVSIPESESMSQAQQRDSHTESTNQADGHQVQETASGQQQQPASRNPQTKADKHGKAPRNLPVQSKQPKIVPLAYFDAAVEIKAGIGLMWQAGQGTVSQLPEHLSNKSLPRGKGRQANAGATKNQGRARKGDKPRIRVERDTELDADADADVDIGLEDA